MARQKSTRVSRRKFLEMAAVTGVAGVAAACTPAPTAAPTAVPPTAVPPTAAPTKAPAPTNTPVPPTPAPTVIKRATDQTLTFVTTGGGFAFFPTAAGAGERTFLGSIYTPPLILDKDQKLSPGLLSSWESNADATVWTLKLDPKAVWSDGSKITATDLKLGWEANNDPIPAGVKQLTKFLTVVDLCMDTVKGQKEYRAGTAKEIEGLKVVDEGTLRVEMAMTDELFPLKLGKEVMAIQKAEQWRNDFTVYEKPEALTNGPYKLTKYDVEGNEYWLEPNPKWWGKAPILKKIIFRWKIDATALVAAWKNKQIDGNTSNSALFEDVEVKKLGTVVLHPYAGISLGFYFNVSKEPMNDINLRKAMMLAADVNSITNATSSGQAQPVLGILQPELPCWPTRDRTYPFDVAAAKAALAQSKYGSGDNVPKLTACQAWDQKVPDYEAVVQSWRDNLGLRIDWVQDNTARNKDTKNQYDITSLSVGAALPDPYVMLKGFYTHMADPTGAYYAQIKYKNDAVVAALAEVAKLKMSDPTRCAKVQAIEKMMLDDYFANGTQRVRMRYYLQPWVKGVATNTDTWIYNLPEVYIEEH